VVLEGHLAEMRMRPRTAIRHCDRTPAVFGYLTALIFQNQALPIAATVIGTTSNRLTMSPGDSQPVRIYNLWPRDCRYTLGMSVRDEAGGVPGVAVITSMRPGTRWAPAIKGRLLPSVIGGQGD
jgi:hypothetical protein